ncbi:hypothetical protein EDD22DRAFT_954949 [Suillus occidentalis]|nr:hypothetical protein EDD22DRAFT_954949 [Suillus occidentalis]
MHDSVVTLQANISKSKVVFSAKNLQVPSERIPAGIFISIDVDSQRCWKSTIGVLSFEKSVVWGDTVTLSSDASPVLSVEIRASYEDVVE